MKLEGLVRIRSTRVTTSRTILVTESGLPFWEFDFYEELERLGARHFGTAAEGPHEGR
jgi:hypothetical protein